MNLIGVEITDMEQGRIQVIECGCGKGRIKVKNAILASFGFPFLEVRPQILKELLRKNGIKGRNVLVVLPEGTHKSVLWTVYCESKESNPNKMLLETLKESNNELDITKNTVVKSSLTGRDECRSYGITTAVESDTLDEFYRVFKSFDIKYMLPQMTVYAMQRYESASGDVGLLDIKNDRLTLAVYHKSILVWTISASYSGKTDEQDADYIDQVVCEAALKVYNAAKNNRYYLSGLYLTGALAGFGGMDTRLSNRLEISCVVDSYTQEPMHMEQPTLSALINVMRQL